MDDEKETEALFESCQAGLGVGQEVSPRMVESLANMARTEAGRERIRSTDLLARLGAATWSAGDQHTAIEVCRLAGNVCYDSPLGRRLVLEAGIMDKLAETLTDQDMEQSSRLWLVLPSFLHNYCHDNLDCLDSVTNIATVLARHFSSVSQHEELDTAAENYLDWLSGLAAHKERLSLYSKPEIVRSVLHLLQLVRTDETVRTVLEFLQEHLDSEDLSNAYADQEVVRTLMTLSTSTFIEEETTNLSLDVLVLLSSHSSVLPRVLSPSPDCGLWRTLLSWLTSPPSPHHLATAALLCGNISTSSSACLEVMETSVPADIIRHMTSDHPGKVLHALLGCLRNLTVCEGARERLVQLGLAERASALVVRLSQGRDHTVTPKLLSTLRLVSQNSAPTCSSLGTDPDLVNGLVTIGQVSIVPGLNIEASRLLSSLLRYSREARVGVLLVEAGAVPLLLGLLNSPHSQLINEMLVALALLTAPRPPLPALVENINPSFLSVKIKEILGLEEEKCPLQVKYNAMSLVNSILQWDIASIKDKFSRAGLREEMGNFDQDTELVQQMMKLLS